MSSQTDDPAAPRRAAAAGPGRDERLGGSASIARLLRRPEFGALLGAIVVASPSGHHGRPVRHPRRRGALDGRRVDLGIMAVVVALLMIGGEFDLSAGVMTGSAGLLIGLLVTEARPEHLGRDRADDVFAACASASSTASW